MASDRMGNQVNLKGIAIFELRIGKDGRVVYAKAISNHPIALSLLIARMDRWRFRPYVRDANAVEAFGRLKIRFSVSEHNKPTVEVM